MRDKIIFRTLLVFIISLNLTAALFTFQVWTGRFHGTVEDEEGNPLKGVKIVVQNLNEEAFKLEAESNEEGKWYVIGVKKGKYIIIPTKRGYESGNNKVQLSQFTSRNPIYKIRMRKSVATDMPSIMDEESVGLFEEGNKVFAQKKFAEALVIFEEFLGKNSTIYQLNLNIGNCYREMGEYDKAISAYNKILENVKTRKKSIEGDKNAAKALANIGEIYLIQDNIEKAGEYFKLAVDSFPENEAVALNVGAILFKQGDTKKAIEYFNLAIKIKESWATPYLQLGYAYLNEGEYKLAIESLKKFLELDPDNPEAANVNNLIPTIEELIKE